MPTFLSISAAEWAIVNTLTETETYKKGRYTQQEANTKQNLTTNVQLKKTFSTASQEFEKTVLDTLQYYNITAM